MYDFDTPIDRRGTNSYKWDSVPYDDVLPLWVADMDFATAPCVQEAVKRRAEHPVFGYVRVPDSYYRSVIEWFDRRHGFGMEREWIIYTSGVVPAVSATIQAVCEAGDKVLVQTPVYNCFFSSIRNSRCQTADSPLRLVDNRYEMDFDDLEKKAADPAVKLMLLCNPHNPAGRAWTRDELQRVGDICLKHNVLVVSDEIHNELTMPGKSYTSFGTLGEPYLTNAVVLTSPSKAFNIAGLQIANITVKSPTLRRKINRAINVNEVCDVNPFGVEALQAAYTKEGEAWLEELREYLGGNYRALREFVGERMPELKVVEMEATYLVWVDCSAMGMESDVLEERLMEEQHVWFNAGKMYQPEGSRFVRINIACPRERLREALRRFEVFARGILQKEKN